MEPCGYAGNLAPVPNPCYVPYGSAVTKFDKPIVTENLNDRVIIKVLKTNASLGISDVS